MSGLARHLAAHGRWLLHITRQRRRSEPSKPEGRLSMSKHLALCAVAIVIATPAVALAKPPLREVPRIYNGLYAIALADEIRQNCDSLNGRVLKAIGILRGLRRHANDLGYSDDEIRTFIDSDAEKDRMRAKGEAFLAANGVSYDNPDSFCTLGRAEIAKNSAIGALLKAN